MTRTANQSISRTNCPTLDRALRFSTWIAASLVLACSLGLLATPVQAGGLYVDDHLLDRDRPVSTPARPRELRRVFTAEKLFPVHHALWQNAKGIRQAWSACNQQLGRDFAMLQKCKPGSEEYKRWSQALDRDRRAFRPVDEAMKSIRWYDSIRGKCTSVCLRGRYATEETMKRVEQALQSGQIPLGRHVLLGPEPPRRPARPVRPVPSERPAPAPTPPGMWS